MPLGNLTSQFFANVYLNELDYFVKHELKAKYYIRYVDDFVIFSNKKTELHYYLQEIDLFLKENLALTLHPQKSTVVELKRGINFLGFRCFYYNILLRHSNIRKYRWKLQKQMLSETPYDCVYESFQGWCAYALNANTYNLRKKTAKLISDNYPNEISNTEIGRLEKLAGKQL